MKTQKIHIWKDGDWAHEHDSGPFDNHTNEDGAVEEYITVEMPDFDDYYVDQAFINLIVPQILREGAL